MLFSYLEHRVCTIVMLFSYLEHHYVIYLSEASLCYLVMWGITMLFSYQEHHYVI
jgi:hypothetical protein